MSTDVISMSKSPEYTIFVNCKINEDTYETCRTKWRLATYSYQLHEMLGADWSVELSIIYLA